MTGTAETESGEFAHTCKMNVAIIPTNQPVLRIDFKDLVCKARREKLNYREEGFSSLETNNVITSRSDASTRAPQRDRRGRA